MSRRCSNKTRFSSSESWDLSKVYSGKLYKLGQGRVSKVWKQYYVCLRDDSSFRWYRDDTFLDRRGEVWLEEVATTIRFGVEVAKHYGPIPRAQKNSIIKDENLIGFEYSDVTKRIHQKRMLFSATNRDELIEWANHFAEVLEANAVFPLETSPLCPQPPDCASFRNLAGSPPLMRKQKSTWLKAWGLTDNDTTTDAQEPKLAVEDASQ